MAESIREKNDRYYGLIKDLQPGDPDTRYKSWEYCHKAFIEEKNKLLSNPDLPGRDRIMDNLALHLAFYLASWGMYRGSTFLLQRDYKTHLKAVEIIMPPYTDPDIDKLWDYDPEVLVIERANDLLFQKGGIYWQIKDAYSGNDVSGEGVPSETLITKILMGTFGCVPAFDRFLRRGIQDYMSRYGKTVSFKNHSYKLTQSLETSSPGTASESFKALAAFAGANKEQLQTEGSDPQYPLMKCVDMYFWETGYELDLADELENKNTSETKISRLLKQAKKQGLIRGSCSPEDAAEQIRAKNRS